MSGVWGLGGWGIGGWGGGGGVAISIQGAYATSTNTVLVTLTSEPEHDNPLVDGDALNAVTWTVENVDDGFTFTILGVREISTTEFEIQTLEPFGDWLHNHRVLSTSLRSISGALISPPTSADWNGVQASVRTIGGVR